MDLRGLSDRIANWILSFLEDEDVYEGQTQRDGFESVAEAAREMFQEEFYNRSPRYAGLAIVSLVVLWLVDFVYCGVVPNQTYGLMLDFAGAGILARGLLKGQYRLAIEITELAGVHKYRNQAVAAESVDGVWGIGLLLSGILLQFTSFVFNGMPCNAII